MSGSNDQPPPEQELAAAEEQVSKEEVEAVDEGSVLSPQQQEDAIKKKYGFLPKKPPLISKDHERAFFDSADWALGKGSSKPKGPLEALRPKLQPTPHQQHRRSAYAPAGEGGVEGEGDIIDPPLEVESSLESGGDADDNNKSSAA